MAKNREKRQNKGTLKQKIKTREMLVKALSTCSFTFQNKTSEAFLRLGCGNENHYYPKMGTVSLQQCTQGLYPHHKDMQSSPS